MLPPLYAEHRMTLFYFKSLMSLLIVSLTLVSMFTMFEIFGRSEKRYQTERLKKIHKITGVLYLLVFLLITYFCVRFIVLTKTGLSVRATFHGLFALMILVLLSVKVLYIRVYKEYYNQAKVLGLLVSLITFGMVGTSAGYYLAVSEFGTETSYDRIVQYKERTVQEKKEKKEEAHGLRVKTDPESIGRGKNIFDTKCSFCHNAYNTEVLVGPGLKGILKNPEFPVSKRSATPENIRMQLIKPISRMPSFDYLSEEEIGDLIAFLNTL